VSQLYQRPYTIRIFLIWTVTHRPRHRHTGLIRSSDLPAMQARSLCLSWPSARNVV